VTRRLVAGYFLSLLSHKVRRKAATGIDVADPDPAWPRRYEELTSRIREALGWRTLQLEHVGSTSVPRLAAKPTRGEHVMQYNACKEQVIREIYHRAFVAAGLLEE
jgi:GrpB protein